MTSSHATRNLVTSTSTTLYPKMVSARIRRNAPLILALEKASQSVKSATLRNASKDFVPALVEIAHNIISGGVNITGQHLNALRRHKQAIKELLKKKTTLNRRRKILQKGGFLGLLLKPAISLLGGILGPMLGGLGGGNRR